MTHVTRRGILAGIGLSIPATAMLTGCGGGRTPGGAAGSGLSAWALSGARQDVYKKSFERWDEENPDDTFSVEYFANDAYKEKIRTAVGSGNAPTLIYNWAGGALGDYVTSGDVADLTGKVDELGGRVIPSVMAAGKIDGKQYAVPSNDSQPVILFLNKPLLEQHGITPPTTWEELLAAIDALKSAGLTPISLAGSSVWPELMWIEYLADRIGGETVFEDIAAQKKDAWSNPAITGALEKIVELVDAGAFGDGFSSVVADAGADVALIHTDKAGMLLQGSWVYGSFKQDAPDFVSGGKLGYLTFPAVTGGSGDPVNIVGNPANYWAVSATADEDTQAKAIEYLNGFNLDEAAVDDIIALGGIPAVTGIEERLSSTGDDAEFLGLAYSMVSQAPHFQLSWDQALTSSQSQELLTNLSQVFLKQKSPADFVAAMNATIE